MMGGEEGSDGEGTVIESALCKNEVDGGHARVVKEWVRRGVVLRR